MVVLLMMLMVVLVLMVLVMMMIVVLVIVVVLMMVVDGGAGASLVFDMDDGISRLATNTLFVQDDGLRGGAFYGILRGCWRKQACKDHFVHTFVR